MRVPKKKNVVGLRREGIAKKGEKRAAIIPEDAGYITKLGYRLIVQPSVNPVTGEDKRIFKDKDYAALGAEINEDLSEADIIFGLKEINVDRVLQGKVYYLFSHTHKGQLKNRHLLKTMLERKNTLIDYELVTDENGKRLLNAFTYNAGYAGMVDSLWSLGKRLSSEGIKNPFEIIPQSIEVEDLIKIKEIVKKAGKEIEEKGTPEEIPPVITAFLGRGKTSKGAQEIFDLLPVKEIKFKQLHDVFHSGSRKKVYKLILTKGNIYQLKKEAESQINFDVYLKLQKWEREHHYMMNPKMYESNLKRYLPYITILMNCVVWSPKFPRSLTKKMMKEVYKESTVLKVIGDITCDPNGSIEFSKETWIDNPVYTYYPMFDLASDGFSNTGITVMAVTNLPCEFSADASRQFSNDLSPFLKSILSADYSGSLQDSNLPPEIKRGVILWKGNFTEKYRFMNQFIENVNRNRIRS
jgi:alanine dehydrogenase